MCVAVRTVVVDAQYLSMATLKLLFFKLWLHHPDSRSYRDFP